MKKEYVLVMMTAPSLEVAERISAALLDAKLAACVNILPGMQSHYTWQGEIQHDQEVLLLAKTRYELFNEEFMRVVRQQHPYEVPEIITLPIQDGAPNYLGWIDEVTRS